MKRIIDHIRDHLERSAFGHKFPSLAELRQSEWVPEFEQLMRNRLLMGAFRYGLLQEKIDGQSHFKLLPSIRKRLDAYESTGNQEHLVDIANLCMLEFVMPSIHNAHFKPIDDGEHVETVT